MDDTGLSWLKEHPNARRVYAVNFYFPVDPMQILPALVEAYTRLGNPGRFQLRALNRDSFDVVWNGVSSVPTVSGSAGGRWASKKLSSAGRVRLEKGLSPDL